MIRTRLAAVVLAVPAALAGVASPAHATAQEPRILFGRLDVYVGTPIIGGLNQLGLDYTTVVGSQALRDQMRAQEWDLVIVRTNRLFVAEFEADVLTELEAHVGSGGALHFQMADLDRAPRRYLDLLGLDGAVDLELPLANIRAPQPVHPSVVGAGFLNLGNELFGPDYGDALVPGPQAFVTQTFGDGGQPSTVIAADGRVLTNGQEWDNWESAAGFAREQIRWLLSCKGDFDADGDLTVFDFLEFQNLFNAHDVRADVFYDGSFDIFDFLAFFNQFEDGC